MAKKIVLFVSTLSGRPAQEYVCPDGNTVTGVQTNEAPCKYLLMKYADVSELLGIVTPEADAAWEYLQSSLRRFCSEEDLPIPVFSRVAFHTGNSFAGEVLPVILNHINPNDEILLETTGGFRNDVMYLLLLSRILSYTSVPVTEAVYSNYNTQPKKIQTISHLFTMFDLAEGMQNLSFFGNVQVLRAYYKNRPLDQNVETLLTTMEQLTEAITLCRTRQIDRCMDQFNTTLTRLKQEEQIDPLLQQLLPVFRSKFGKDEKMTTPTLIRWCVDNGMLQQALTVYTEQIPAYLLNPHQGCFLSVDESAATPPDPPQQSYESKELAWFLRSFLHLPKNTTARLYGAFRQYIQTHEQEIERAASAGRIPRDTPKELQPAVKRMVDLVQAARPCIGTKHWKGRWEHRLPSRFSGDMIIRINKQQYTSVSNMINDFQVFKTALIAELFGQKQVNTYLEMMRNPEPYLNAPGSGYSASCSMDLLKAMLCDYIYIKFLRNMTNHANNESQKNQREILDYLNTCGYQDIDNLSAAELKKALLRALEHLDQAEAEQSVIHAAAKP